jgi:hypothetical protein
VTIALETVAKEAVARGDSRNVAYLADAWSLYRVFQRVFCRKIFAEMKQRENFPFSVGPRRADAADLDATGADNAGY